MLIGNKVHNLPYCHSTNDYLKDLMTKNVVSDGEVVVTERQTNGKGQRGNSWESEDGKNLTFSFLLYPKDLLPNEQFNLNYFVTLSIYDFLKHVLGDINSIKIKWPNDIYVDDKKIGGILIENHIIADQIFSSIIGIGLNINQIDFVTPNATSIALLNKDTYNIKESLGMLLHYLNRYVKQLKNVESLRSLYFDNLLGYHEIREFIDPITQGKFMGKIVDVDSTGKLHLKTHDLSVKVFDLKEIQFVL